MDTLILHALATRAKFRQLRQAVPDGMLSQDTSAMLQWFAAYYEAFPEREKIEWPELESLVRLRAGNASEDSIAITLRLVQMLQHERPDDIALAGILGQLNDLDLSGRTAALIEKYNNGAEINLAYELARLSQAAVRMKSQSTPDDFIDTPISELLSEVADDRGLKFRFIQAMRDSIMGLQGGASVAIAARPDKGKTSLIAKIMTDFAPQVVGMYGDKRPLLWLNNEGSGKRIIPRLYQAALGKDLNEIIAMSNRDELQDAYIRAIGGVSNLIRVKDMHGASMAMIEQVLEVQRPAVCVADMLGNFHLGGGQSGKSNKADVIEGVWQEWRELMVRYDCVGLATIQISAEGDNMLYPTYSALKDSKTAVQGATDVILMMGSLNNPEAQTIRGLSSPKNKYAVPGRPSSFQAEVYFDGSRCQFSDGLSGAPAVPGQEEQK